eukprot:RCo026353
MGVAGSTRMNGLQSVMEEVRGMVHEASLGTIVLASTPAGTQDTVSTTVVEKTPGVGHGYTTTRHLLGRREGCPGEGAHNGLGHGETSPRRREITTAPPPVALETGTPLEKSTTTAAGSSREGTRLQNLTPTEPAPKDMRTGETLQHTVMLPQRVGAARPTPIAEAVTQKETPSSIPTAPTKGRKNILAPVEGAPGAHMVGTMLNAATKEALHTAQLRVMRTDMLSRELLDMTTGIRWMRTEDEQIIGVVTEPESPSTRCALEKQHGQIFIWIQKATEPCRERIYSARLYVPIFHLGKRLGLISSFWMICDVVLWSRLRAEFKGSPF